MRCSLFVQVGQVAWARRIRWPGSPGPTCLSMQAALSSGEGVLGTPGAQTTRHRCRSVTSQDGRADRVHQGPLPHARPSAIFEAAAAAAIAGPRCRRRQHTGQRNGGGQVPEARIEEAWTCTLSLRTPVPPMPPVRPDALARRAKKENEEDAQVRYCTVPFLARRTESSVAGSLEPRPAPVLAPAGPPSFPVEKARPVDWADFGYRWPITGPRLAFISRLHSLHRLGVLRPHPPAPLAPLGLASRPRRKASWDDNLHAAQRERALLIAIGAALASTDVRRNPCQFASPTLFAVLYPSVHTHGSCGSVDASGAMSAIPTPLLRASLAAAVVQYGTGSHGMALGGETLSDASFYLGGVRTISSMLGPCPGTSPPAGGTHTTLSNTLESASGTLSVHPLALRPGPAAGRPLPAPNRRPSVHSSVKASLCPSTLPGHLDHTLACRVLICLRDIAGAWLCRHKRQATDPIACRGAIDGLVPTTARALGRLRRPSPLAPTHHGRRRPAICGLSIVAAGALLEPQSTRLSPQSSQHSCARMERVQFRQHGTWCLQRPCCRPSTAGASTAAAVGHAPMALDAEQQSPGGPPTADLSTSVPTSVSSTSAAHPAHVGGPGPDSGVGNLVKVDDGDNDKHASEDTDRPGSSVLRILERPGGRPLTDSQHCVEGIATEGEISGPRRGQSLAHQTRETSIARHRTCTGRMGEESGRSMHRRRYTSH
nr:hypothetical protein CFP56_11459 [Quercus suber]